MLQGFESNPTDLDRALGVKRRQAEVALPVDSLIAKSGLQAVITDLLIPGPAGEVIQTQVERADPNSAGSALLKSRNRSSPPLILIWPK